MTYNIELMVTTPQGKSYAQNISVVTTIESIEYACTAHEYIYKV